METQTLQRQTTQLSTAPSALQCCNNEWDNLATVTDVDEALTGIQQAKGKWYSEVMARFWGEQLVIEKTLSFKDELIALFVDLKVDREDLKRITLRLKQSECTGTTYQPLPDIAMIAKTIKEVQGETTSRRIMQPSKQAIQHEIIIPEHRKGMSIEELFFDVFGEPLTINQ